MQMHEDTGDNDSFIALLLHFHAGACRPRLLSRLERQQLRRLKVE
jgi:hypothetical protein